jgi:hypothetical protein
MRSFGLLRPDLSMKLTLVRRDDAQVKIELVRWQITLRGFFGYTKTMILQHRTPTLFPKSVWRAVNEETR